MENGQPINLLITHIDKEGPFLKIWGQAEKSSSIYVEQFLSGASHQFDQGVGTLTQDQLQVGNLVCAKYKDGKYYRARILSIDILNECFIEVSFIDYGNKDIVPAPNLRSLQNFPPTFISILPLATSFIFAEVHSPQGGEWNDKVFGTIYKELCFREVQCTLIAQATQFYLIKLFIGNSDLANLFIGRGLLQPISIQAQQAVLLSCSMQKRLTPATTMQTVPSEINTYKVCTLEPGCQYPVYVSYVNEGPTHFSVQLRQSEEVLVKLMKDINSVTLKLLEEVPLPGTICLAKCQEDNSICRAVVTNEVDNQFKVFYVDFGNYEVVSLDALYQIPFKFVLPKVMAIRFGLLGIEKSSVTLEMKCAFKKFVDNRLLHMKVLPSPMRMSVAKCELWDPETKVSALEVVQRAALNAYPEPLSLNRGFTQPVKVSYVFSCNRFYTQLVSKEMELAKLMADLQSSCQNTDVMDPAEIKVELPCCALFEGDQQWYRSQIVEVVDQNNVKVRYIDFGNEEIVPNGLLKIMEGELLTVLRPQAIECCLNGYQNMEVDIERDTLLEELILEKQFTMKVVEMMGKKALVELIDEANYNVASLLLDKIAASKALVSPVIVPSNTRSEQSWRSPQNGTNNDNRSERRPQRDDNRNWNENRTNEKSWRQDNSDTRSDRNSNDNSNWRKNQNNKDFRSKDDQSNQKGISDRLRRDKKPNTDNWGNEESQDWGTPDTSAHQTPKNFASSNGGFGDGEWNNTSPESGRGNDNRFKKPRDDNAYGGGRNKRFEDKENWNSRDNRGGFKKKSDFRKDDVSSNSGSEKSFKKGPRTSSRNDRPRGDKFGGGGGRSRDRSSFMSQTNAEESWNVSALSLPALNAASSTDQFTNLDVVGTEAGVNISWFHNPTSFYCQLTSSQNEIKQMMEDIQEFYKGRQPESAVKGAPVIGLFPEDNVLYRGRVLDVFGSQYKILYVDFGNVSTIDKVWSIEKKFMTLPAQAILCGLSYIGPPGDTWPSANVYGKYFGKENYIARFLHENEKTTYVELFNEDQNIAELLVNEGTAAALTQPAASTDIEIPLLLGQQLRVVVKSINNLSDIIVALECGLALSCKAHNLESASETFENNLKDYVEQTVILYVDNVLENNVLDVTFYDNDGNKINILTPDEGAFETVEPICQFTVLNSTIWGYVSHTEEQSVFIQSLNTDAAAILLDALFEFYEQQVQEAPLIPEEGLLYAVHSSDGNWYRGRVTSFDDEKATVMYLDYGNSESVPFTALRALDSQFYVPDVMCIQIHTQGPTEQFLNKEVTATIYYGESGWEGTVQESTQSHTMTTDAEVPPVVEPLTTVQEVPTAEEAAVSEEPAPTTTEPVASVEAPGVASKGTPVFVSHIDSPTEFYLQRAEASTELEDLQMFLQEVVESLDVVETVTVGVLCAAPYSVNHEWYRAEVLDADDDITTVRFIDYGNTDVINNKTTQIKTLTPSLLSQAVHATKCSLKVQPLESDEGEWTQTALECFEELAQQNEIFVEFIGQDEKTNYVELYTHGKSVTQVLIELNHAKACEVSAETMSTGFVSHFNSPSEFWIQLESCVDELEWIAEQLSGAEAFPELEDLTPGTLCAALFADDEMWYRARILSNTVAGIELLFIDYGNSCISASLRQLPEDLVVTAPLAQKCSLQRPAALLQWTPQSCEKFREISADGQTIFVVKKISTGETSIVDLLVNGSNVADLLIPETVDGYVKNVNNLDDFKVETNGELSSDVYKLEPLPGVQWDDESCEKFKEINNEGTTLFQIEFLGENTVRLYNKGSDIRLDLGGIKRVQQSPSKILEFIKTEQEQSGKLVPEEEVCEDIIQCDALKPPADQISTENNTSTDDSQFYESSNDIKKNKHFQTSTEKDITPDSLLEEDNAHILNESEKPVESQNITFATQHLEKGDNNKIKTEKQIDAITEELRYVKENTNIIECNQIDSGSDEQNSQEVVYINNTGTEEQNLEEIKKSKVVVIEPEGLDKLTNNTLNPQENCDQFKTGTEERNVKKIKQAEVNVAEEKDSVVVSNNTPKETGKLELDTTIEDKQSQVKQQSKLDNEKDTKVDEKTVESTVQEVQTNICSNKENDIECMDKVQIYKQEKSEPSSGSNSRPLSACSGKISHDDRILPAVLSRPHTPLASDEGEDE